MCLFPELFRDYATMCFLEERERDNMWMCLYADMRKRIWMWAHTPFVKVLSTSTLLLAICILSISHSHISSFSKKNILYSQILTFTEVVFGGVVFFCCNTIYSRSKVVFLCVVEVWWNILNVCFKQIVYGSSTATNTHYNDIKKRHDGPNIKFVKIQLQII